MPDSKLNYHMPIDDFRKHGKQIIDWIADYLENIESYPVMSTCKSGDIRKQLPKSPPKSNEPFAKCIKDLDDIIMKGITHWQSPDFYAYFPSNSSLPSILGYLLSAGLGVQGMLWATSPACTELETHILDWIAEMLDLPEKYYSHSNGGGVIQDSASSATLCAVLAGREKATGFCSNLNGVGENKLVAYASEHAHSSIDKAVKIAGIGANNLRKIPADDNFSMLPDQLDLKIEEDLRAGFIPFFVCGTVGSTSSCAIDPINEIGSMCRKYDLWFHIDAAYAGSAAVCPEFRYLNSGLQLANSYSFNPHKFMLTNFDCNCFFVDDKNALINTLTIAPEYLKNKNSDENRVIDYRDWQIPLGRRFRALKLWFVIRNYGVEGIRKHIRYNVKLAELFEAKVINSKDFQLSAKRELGLVCFRYNGSDGINQSILDKVNSSGKIFISHTVLNGRYTLRFCTGQLNTTEEHINKAWKLIESFV
ncbi:MAG TPA: pyridoxal-dependent decarboxylase [Victivallales bacterium]|nr:pyridoxal-dependent decarboxylase [Victivallales bacterium]